MKKLFVLFAVAVLAACGGASKSDNPLIGKWEFASLDMAKVEAAAPTGDSTTDSLTKAMGDMASGMGEMGKAMAESLLKGTIYEFQDGGKCSMTILGFPVDGTYTVSEDKKWLSMTQSGKTEKMEIVSNNDKELVLKGEDGNTMHFTRK